MLLKNYPIFLRRLFFSNRRVLCKTVMDFWRYGYRNFTCSDLHELRNENKKTHINRMVQRHPMIYFLNFLVTAPHRFRLSIV